MCKSMLGTFPSHVRLFIAFAFKVLIESVKRNQLVPLASLISHQVIFLLYFIKILLPCLHCRVFYFCLLEILWGLSLIVILAVEWSQIYTNCNCRQSCLNHNSLKSSALLICDLCSALFSASHFLLHLHRSKRQHGRVGPHLSLLPGEIPSKHQSSSLSDDESNKSK